MSTYVRFQTQLRCRWTNRPAGVFAAAGHLEDSANIPDGTRELLDQHLKWFNKNLAVPALDDYGWRCLFWFRSDAKELIERIWDLAAILRDEGVFVRKVWTTDPGRVIYRDKHQIGAVPDKKTIALRV